MVIIQSIIIGVVSGLVASICYACIKQLFRPKVKIANIMVRRKEQNVLVVKVINRSKISIRDVSCHLTYYERMPDGYKIKILDSHRTNSSIIEKYSNDKDDADAASLYAVQYAFDIPTELKFNNNDKFVFSFKATHPISGTSIYKTEEYLVNSDDIRDDVMYNSGDNIGVHIIDR